MSEAIDRAGAKKAAENARGTTGDEALAGCRSILGDVRFCLTAAVDSHPGVRPMHPELPMARAVSG